MIKNTKALFILPYFSLGGAETQAFNIAIGLKERGVDVAFLAFDLKDGGLVKKLDEYNIPWLLSAYNLDKIHQKGLGKIVDLLKLIREVRSFSPDVLFPFTYYPNITISAIWRFTGAKNCFWNQRGQENNSLTMIERIAVKMKPNYLSNGETAAQYISERHGLKNKNVQVIPNGVFMKPPQKSKEFWREKIGVSHGVTVYTMVANFFPVKNHLYLLKAWKEFSRASDNNRHYLVLIGYSINEIILNSIKALCYDHKLTNVKIMDSEDDIAGLLSVTDIGILTSKSEGCPNAVLEYMASGIPAIVSRIPATEEIFGKEYQLYCDLDNPETLSKCLETIRDSKMIEEHKVMGINIINNVYSFKSLVDSYLKLVSALK